MTAAFGTLLFLVTIWLLVVMGAAMLEESGAKIAAALKRQASTDKVAIAPVRLRTRMRLQQPIRASAEWRAAA